VQDRNNARFPPFFPWLFERPPVRAFLREKIISYVHRENANVGITQANVGTRDRRLAALGRRFSLLLFFFTVKRPAAEHLPAELPVVMKARIPEN
jgi:hypothetical protein